jgi:hypothetical protein
MTSSNLASGLPAHAKTTALRRAVMAAAFLLVAAVSVWIHGPLSDSCEPTCSPEYRLHSNLRVPAIELLVYANSLILPLLAGIAAIAAFFWRPLSGRPGVVLLIVLAILVALDGWVMRYW